MNERDRTPADRPRRGAGWHNAQAGLDRGDDSGSRRSQERWHAASGTSIRPRSDADGRADACLRGIAVSPGIAIGPILVLDPRGMRLPPRKVRAEAIERELERLDHGLEAASREAEEAEAKARTRLGPQYADILAAHARMIGDVTLRGMPASGSSRADIGRACRHRSARSARDRLERLSDSTWRPAPPTSRDIEARILGHWSAATQLVPG